MTIKLFSKIVSKAIIPLFLFIILSGCSENPIFYNLENEVKLNDGNLSNSITLYALDKIEGATDYYIAAGKKVWTKTPADNSWSTMSNPDGYNKETSGLTSMVLFDNGGSNKIITGAFYQDAGDGATALFTKNYPAEDNWNLVSGSEIDRAGSSTSYTYYRYYLFIANDHLFVNMVKYYRNSDKEISIVDSAIYHYSPGSALSINDSALITSDMPTTFTTTKTKLNAVVYDGSSYWMIYNSSSSDTLHGHAVKGTPGSSFIEHTIDSVRSFCFETMYYTSNNGGELLISSNSFGSTNYIYNSHDSGTTWLKEPTSKVFSCFTDIHGLNSDTDYVILGGTRAYGSTDGSGYYEIKYSDTTNISIKSNNFSESNNYSSTKSDLSSGSIQKLFYDPEYSIIFAATYNTGLWKNTENSTGTERIWVWE